MTANPTDIDIRLMNEAVELAKTGIGQTGANPSAGCIITDANGTIVARSRTGDGGSPHAEVAALQIAGSKARNSVLYTTLEPCAHHGNNPPCCDHIIAAGISKVVVGCQDPNPLVNGKGLSRLLSAGIEVIHGVNEIRCQESIAGFTSRIIHKRPLVTLKIATSLDGKIALKNGASRWITTQSQRQHAHWLRRCNDAIMVGIGTVIADDPLLTCRHHPTYKQPIRVILDSQLRIAPESRLCRTANEVRTVIMTTTADVAKVKTLEQLGCAVIVRNSSSIAEWLGDLAAMGVNNLLVEGGQKLATALLKHGHIDKLVQFIGPVIIGDDGIGAFSALNLTDVANAPSLPSIEIITWGRSNDD